MSGNGAFGEFPFASGPEGENVSTPPRVYDGSETGLYAFSPPPDNFDGLSADDAVALIREWFFSNFEDPANSVGYNGREGGYLHVFGPYDTRDVIENVFAGIAGEEIIAAAVDDIEADGGPWAPSLGRVQPPDDAFEGSTEPDVRSLHAEVLQRVSAVEKAMEALAIDHAGIGHNNPPEPMEESPLDEAAREEVLRALESIRAQPPEPSTEPKEALEAAGRLKLLGERIRQYFAAKGDLFVSEAVKSAGAETGKWIVRLPMWLMLSGALLAAAAAVARWAAAVAPPF